MRIEAKVYDGVYLERKRVVLGFCRSFFIAWGLFRTTSASAETSRSLWFAGTDNFDLTIHRSFTDHSQFTHASKITADCPPCDITDLDKL